MDSEKCRFAAACIAGDGAGANTSGIVQFHQREEGVLVEAKVYGLPKGNASGFFAFHIHEGEDCSGEGFSVSGGHYNPDGTAHPTHRGDLPPLLSCNGSAYLAVLTNRFTVSEVIGKTVIIHGGPEDFQTQPSGNAGSKIACGIIKCE